MEKAKPGPGPAQPDPPFDLSQSRSQLEQALTRAGFDLLPDPTEPNLLQARADRGPDTAEIVLDGGGNLRYSRTRPTGPQQSLTHIGKSGHVFQVTQVATQTITVSYGLSATDPANFAALLSDLAAI